MQTRNILIGAAALTVVLGATLWMNRADIIFNLVSGRGKVDVAPTVAIDWRSGVSDLPEDERPPNIVFILADDLGINDLSTFGGGVAGGTVPTPNIDALAASGANFLQAYTGTASCAPSRAMLMTGRYPTRTGFEFTPTPDGMARMITLISDGDRGRPGHLPHTIYNEEADKAKPPYGEQGLPGSEITLAEVLKPRGYHTVHIGKWHLGRGEEFGANAQGFDESLLMASGLYLPEDDPNTVNAKVDFDPIDRFLWANMQYAAQYNEGDLFEPGGYLTDYWTDEAVKVIEANKERPFFLYLAHWGVHTPLQATRADYDAVSHIEDHTLRVYAAMVRSLDRSVGRIREALEENGLLDNTIVVFSSDNGGAGYIGLPDINQPYRGWKLTFFEGGIRAPFFISWPEKIPAGTKIDPPVAHIDIMPTLAAAAGASLPDDRKIDGVNLLPFALGTAKRDRPHWNIYWQSAHHKVVRSGDWKLLVSRRPEKIWLYNLQKDPTEQVNVAEGQPEVVAKLTALLDEHGKDARPPLYLHSVEGPISIDKTLKEGFAPGDEVVYWPN